MECSLVVNSVFSVRVQLKDCLSILPHRALLHFLDTDKFKNKEDFIQNYKNLSSFNETEVIFYFRISLFHFEDVASHMILRDLDYL